MLEILATLIILIALAKRGSRKGYRALIVNDTASAGALVADDVAAEDFSQTVDRSTYAISADLVWGTRNFTVGEGPITVGLAHGSYTAAEIEECLEVSTSWDEGNKVQIEQARRLVRTVGSFPLNFVDEVMNDGNPVKTKLGFVLQDGETLQHWIWNKSGGTLTTGGTVITTGHINARRF